MNNIRSIETEVIHAGEDKLVQNSVCPPIFQSSIYVAHEPKSYHDVLYIRSNNVPDQIRLGKKLATLEQGEAAVVTSSGMAAISNTLLSLLQTGSHVLAQKCLYGATRFLFANDFPSLGIDTDFIDPDEPSSWKTKLKTTTKVIYVESISNPLLEIGDLKAVVNFAKQHGLISVIDSTFATPVNFNPLTIGFDLVIHSCSKYINGHYDIVAGCVIGDTSHITPITEKMTHMGSCLDPHVCFLLSRGISTLALRVNQQNRNAMQLAQFLSNHPALDKVIYPGLESHPQHHHAKELFSGYGGMLSFELNGDVEQTKSFLSYLKIPLVAPSLGGVKTLITRPATTSHSEMSASERKDMGISDKLLRVSVGIESIDDLIHDFEKALNKLK
jgi:cystathionine beta-lyase/cystathionine gamma-synthase